jgi:hypothetical protein
MVLTSDTIVTQGASFALWSTFQTWAGAGIVGPITLESTGTITKAAGIVWQDGTLATMNAGASIANLQVRAHAELYRIAY